MRRWALFLAIGLSGFSAAIVLAQGPDDAVTIPAGGAGRTGTLHAATAPAAAATGSLSVTVVLSESFETPFPPSGWLSHSDEDFGLWQQTISGTRAHSGSYSAIHGYFTQKADSWLVTSQVTPSVGSKLTFWQSDRFSHRPFTHSIWISTVSYTHLRAHET